MILTLTVLSSFSILRGGSIFKPPINEANYICTYELARSLQWSIKMAILTGIKNTAIKQKENSV